MAFYINQADSCDASVVIDDQNKGPFLSRVDQTDSAGVTVDKKKITWQDSVTRVVRKLSLYVTGLLSHPCLWYWEEIIQ